MYRPIAAVAAFALPGACAPIEDAQETETAGTRALLFEEDFDAPSLYRSKWNVIGMDFWVNNEQQANLDSPDTIRFSNDVEGADGGALILKPVFRPNIDTNADRQADFISGRINTRDNFDFTYGRAEIDIMEYVGEPEWSAVAIYGPGYSGDTPFVARRTFPAGQDASDWHVYGLEWTKDAIAFDVDGDVFTP